jgi:hypothetical protein
MKPGKSMTLRKTKHRIAAYRKPSFLDANFKQALMQLSFHYHSLSVHFPVSTLFAFCDEA